MEFNGMFCKVGLKTSYKQFSMGRNNPIGRVIACYNKQLLCDWQGPTLYVYPHLLYHQHLLCHQHLPKFPVFYVPSSNPNRLGQVDLMMPQKDGSMKMVISTLHLPIQKINYKCIFKYTSFMDPIGIRPDSDGKSLHTTTVSVPLGCPHDTLFARSVSRQTSSAREPCARCFGRFRGGILLSW